MFYDLESKKPARDEPQAPKAAETQPQNAHVLQEPVHEARGEPPGKEVVNTSYPLESDMPEMSAPERKRNPLFDRIELDRGGGSALIRGEPPGMPVEKYSGGRIFRILVRTRVHDRPAARSQSIAGLEPDDTVMVESRVGDWLKLRSKKGYPGYIYAQDAVEDDRSR